MGAILLGSTSTKHKMRKGDSRMQCPRNLFIQNNLVELEGRYHVFRTKMVQNKGCWELVLRLGVQRNEDARNLTSLRARRRFPGDLEQPPGNRCRKILYSSVPPDRGTADIRRKNVEVCDVARA